MTTASGERHPYVVLLDRIVAAAEAGDPSDFDNVYAPDAVVWHNHDLQEQSIAENGQRLVDISHIVTDRRYTERRCHVFDGGVVQQHVLRGTNVKTGQAVALHSCVVAFVNPDGRIFRLEEYFDSAQRSAFYVS